MMEKDLYLYLKTYMRMCDILVATPEATKDRQMIFAKNSDRDPNEAQILEYLRRAEHTEDKVQLTYVDSTQVKRTYSVIISRPWWIWGAEMGANEFGLVMGNTALFSRESPEKTGILGMDYVRLALERSRSAGEALDFVLSVIGEFGQGGSGSYEHKFLYYNSFVICDAEEAFVVETVGRHWVWKKVKNVYSVSNAYTIHRDWDVSSSNLIKYSMEKGWCKKEEDFDLAKCYSDKLYTYFAHGRERREFTSNELKNKVGEITLKDMMIILRSHASSPYRPERGSMRDVCMHYGGITRPSQTASSQVSVLSLKTQLHWFTAVSNPCLSIFKPVHFEGGIPDLGEKPTYMYNPNSYWWRIERFHRRFQTCYQKYINEYAKERDALQDWIIEKTNGVMTAGNRHALYDITELAFREEENLSNKWDRIIRLGRLPFLYGYNWKRVNDKAGVPL